MVKNPPASSGNTDLIPNPGRFRRRQWQATPVLLPGKSHGRRSLVGCSPWVAKTGTRLSDFPFTFHFHALEKEMATHSSVPAWSILGTGEPGRLPSMGSHRVRHDWSDLAAAAARKILHVMEQLNRYATTPKPGRRSCWSPSTESLCSTTGEANTVRRSHTTAKSSPLLSKARKSPSKAKTQRSQKSNTKTEKPKKSIRRNA